MYWYINLSVVLLSTKLLCTTQSIFFSFATSCPPSPSGRGPHPQTALRRARLTGAAPPLWHPRLRAQPTGRRETPAKMLESLQPCGRGNQREEGGNIEGKEIRAIAPLYKLTGGVDSLFLRLAEHWQYSAGGGLVDPEHYDNNSVLTIVSMLSDPEDCDGGVFRTHEPDGSMKEHPLSRGDVICFVSHKLHNVTPLLVSLDLEL